MFNGILAVVFIGIACQPLYDEIIITIKKIGKFINMAFKYVNKMIKK